MKAFRIFIIFVFLIFSKDLVFCETKCLKIHFLDVGEGDSVFIETQEGKTVLVDGGNLISGFEVVKFLKKKNIQSLDYLIFTHPDLDHIGGAFFILQLLNAKNIYDNGEKLIKENKFSDVYRWYDKLVRQNKNYRMLKADDMLSFDGVVLNVLWPPKPLPFSDFNANSIVIMLEYKEFHCLLTGDLTAEVERKLLEQEINLKADVLKIGHHGANDANCEEFIKSVAPKIAILSVDSENFRGYPAQESIERFEKAGASLYRTDKDKNIVLSICQNKDGKPVIKVTKNVR
ncbi:MAG: MBL fold metallo-hydrolase [Candidatus Omnitrophota bacterium]|nr:MBL fold metallo-hydrolase [Candidatus Omnitrophota bacterium]